MAAVARSISLIPRKILKVHTAYLTFIHVIINYFKIDLTLIVL